MSEPLILDSTRIEIRGFNYTSGRKQCTSKLGRKQIYRTIRLRIKAFLLVQQQINSDLILNQNPAKIHEDEVCGLQSEVALAISSIHCLQFLLSSCLFFLVLLGPIYFAQADRQQTVYLSLFGQGLNPGHLAWQLA